MELFNQELDIDVQHKIYVMRAVELEPRIWQSAYRNTKKDEYFNMIARNINLHFHTNIFSNGTIFCFTKSCFFK